MLLICQELFSTATQALNKVTLSYIEDLANKGVENALNDDEHLRNGLNIKMEKLHTLQYKMH